jgi:lipoprotein-anchoring transpeptidase ErfK/SrfK
MKKKSKKKPNLFIYVIPILLLLALTVIALTSRRTLVANNGCGVPDLTQGYDANPPVAIFDEKEITVPKMAIGEIKTQVLGSSNDERWIEIDLSEQKIKAWEGNSLYLESLISSGLPWFPTPIGEFRVWAKVRYTKMEGGTGKYYYYLPNVPFVMFFQNDKVPSWRGYGLHGTYWHNDFGRVHSHGCVNLPTSVAEKLFYWTMPALTEGKGWIFADADNPGTRIVIHE